MTEELRFKTNFQDERNSWVKALTELISPSIASVQQQLVTSSHVQQYGNQSVSPNYGKGTDFPKMQNNRAYGYLPPQPAFTSHESKLPLTVPDSSYYVIEKASFDDPEPHTEEADHKDEPKPRASSQESDPGYDYIKDTVPEPEPVSAYSTTPTKNGSTSTITTKLNPQLSSTDRFREEGYTLMQSVGHLQPISSRSNPTLPPPESPMDVSKTLKRLSRFNSDQMEHLIDMLRMTVATQPQNGNSSISEQAAVPTMTTPPPRPPKPTQSDLAISRVSGSDSLAKSRERPSQLSLSSDPVNEDVSLQGSQEHSVYVNSIPLASENENGKSGEEEKERDVVSVPTLVVESTDHEESAPPVQHRKSAGLLNTAETANAIKFKLGEAML